MEDKVIRGVPWTLSSYGAVLREAFVQLTRVLGRAPAAAASA
jgi:hypothetical protein